MTRKRGHLEAVKPGDKPKKTTPKNITEALDGTSRDVWAAMRAALAKKLDAGEVSSNAIRSAYQELRELDRLIRAHDEAEEKGASSGNDSGPRRSFDASAI